MKTFFFFTDGELNKLESVSQASLTFESKTGVYPHNVRYSTLVGCSLIRYC
jgi:hypothetical protein